MKFDVESTEFLSLMRPDASFPPHHFAMLADEARCQVGGDGGAREGRQEAAVVGDVRGHATWRSVATAALSCLWLQLPCPRRLTSAPSSGRCWPGSSRMVRRMCWTLAAAPASCPCWRPVQVRTLRHLCCRAVAQNCAVAAHRCWAPALHVAVPLDMGAPVGVALDAACTIRLPHASSHTPLQLLPCPPDSPPTLQIAPSQARPAWWPASCTRGCATWHASRPPPTACRTASAW